MNFYPSDDNKAAFVRIPRGAEMLGALNEAAATLGIDAGTVQAIGAVSELVVGCYDQEQKRYSTITFPEPLEIASALGNVSLKEGAPFVHMHVTATNHEGRTVGGHLMEGTKVFLIEAYFRTLGGAAPVRTLDDDLGLPVWH